jgi:hypothetical protein
VKQRYSERGRRGCLKGAWDVVSKSASPPSVPSQHRRCDEDAPLSRETELSATAALNDAAVRSSAAVLAALLQTCPEESVSAEKSLRFKRTQGRHGRPDGPTRPKRQKAKSQIIQGWPPFKKTGIRGMSGCPFLLIFGASGPSEALILLKIRSGAARRRTETSYRSQPKRVLAAASALTPR